MARYRSKPVVVEAHQFIEPKDLVAQSSSGFQSARVERASLPPGVMVEARRSGPPVYYVITIHGQRTFLADGDWIITEVDGEHHYPCKPAIFAKRYELIDETPINPLVKLTAIPAGTPARFCQKCPAVVYLVPGKNVGKFVPLAIEPQLETKLGIVSTLARAPTATEDGYGYPHFADCPEAAAFRRKD